MKKLKAIYYLYMISLGDNIIDIILWLFIKNKSLRVAKFKILLIH